MAWFLTSVKKAKFSSCIFVKKKKNEYSSNMNMYKQINLSAVSKIWTEHFYF